MIRDRERTRWMISFLLAGAIIYLEIKKLFAYNFDTLLPYVFFLFTFAILHEYKKSLINNLFYRLDFISLAVNLTVTLYCTDIILIMNTRYIWLYGFQWY